MLPKGNIRLERVKRAPLKSIFAYVKKMRISSFLEENLDLK